MKPSLKILLLEDSSVDAEIIQRLLAKEINNCEVRLAMNKNDFLKQLDVFDADVILSDNSLPKFNAEEALKIVRQRSMHIPFILVTGTVSEEYAANIIRAGADDYILKDRMTRLPAAIDVAVRHRGAEKQKLEATERLIASEENYRVIMERFTDAFVALDKNWCYTYINTKAGEIMHREPGQLLGKHIWTEFPEGIGSAFYNAYYRAMEEQKYVHIEEYYPPFDVWLENHIYPSPNGLSIFFRDITDKKKDEQKVIQSEQNLKAIFDNSTEGFILLDENGVIKALNSRASKGVLFNTDEELSVGSSIFKFVDNYRKNVFKDVIRNVMKGEVIQYDRSYPRPDRQVTWINFSFNPVRNDEKIDGICITATDITERKIAEQLKEFDHNNLHAMINNTDDLMWSVNRNFNLITSNQAFDEMLKLMTGTVPVKGSNILDISITDEEKRRFKKYYERAFAGETFTEIEYNNDPVEFWSEISFNPIFEKKHVIGTACFSHNITDRKKAEELLQKSFNEKQALAERMSAILNALPANIALLDENGIVADVNDAWRFFAESNGFIGSNHGIGSNYLDLSNGSFEYNSDDGKTAARGIRNVLEGKVKDFTFEYSCHSKEVKRWFRMMVVPLQDKEYAGAVVMHIDNSELRRLEEDRLISRVEEQKKIARAMLNAQENERNAIGIELHDNVNQILVGSNLMLSMGKSKPEKAQEMIDFVMGQLRNAINENRKIAHVFVAPDLKTESLEDQLQKLITSMLETLGIKVVINTKKFDECLLDNEQKVNVYRIAQEQCTNIVKYANATAVEITLSTLDSSFKMTISDNGVGMEKGAKIAGIGLKNINGRLTIFNGTANVISEPGKGFKLEIAFPLNEIQV